MIEKLIDRMIRLYGYESPVVIEFCGFCDENPDMKILETIVKCHEEWMKEKR